MDKEPNPFPQIDLFPRLAKVARFILGTEPVPLHMSGHYVREHFHPEEAPAETGAEAMLSQALPEALYSE